MAQLIHEVEHSAGSLAVEPARRPLPSSRIPARQRQAATGVLWPRYIEGLFKRKYVIASALLAALLLAWLALLAWPKQYHSEAKLMIRVGRESVALDPTATTSPTLMLQKTQEEDVNSALDLLRSRRIAERTVDKLGAENIISGFLPTQQLEQPERPSQLLLPVLDFIDRTLPPLLYASGLKQELSPRELAILELSKSLKIHAERRSAVVSIEAFSKSPEMAQAIAQTVGEEFISEYLEVTHNAGSYAFFTSQASAANAARSALEEKKNRFMRERNLLTIAANQSILVEQQGAIEREVILAHAQLDQALAEIEDITQKLSAMPVEVISEKKQSGDATWSGMRQQVYALELEERSLATKYSADNPLLQQVREKLAGGQAILNQLESERVDESTTPNPVRLRLQEELQRQQTKVAGLQANLELRQEQHAEVERKIHSILDSERDLGQIERDIKMADTRLDLLRTKNEEARVLAEMQQDRISNLSLFQPATLIERPASPNKKLLFLGFVVLGLTVGTSLALLQEHNSKRMQTVADVEHGLGLPVMGNIPRIRGASSRPQRLLKRIRQRPVMKAEFQAIISDIMLTAGQPLSQGLRGRTLGVMGIESGDGASTISAALALVAAQHCGLHSMLIDANSENSTLSKLFNLNGAPGLSELANGDATHAECLQTCGESGLSLISSSASYKEQQRLEATPKSLSAAIQNFQEDSDLVIVDLPPAISADRAVALAHYMDAVLWVVESEKTNVDIAQRIVRRLPHSDQQVIGVVLNKTRRYLPKWLGDMIGVG